MTPIATRLTYTPVPDCHFCDESVVANQINEYRVTAVHREFADVSGPVSFPAAVYGFAYLRYDEMLAELSALAAANPGLCRLVDAGPAAGGGMRVWCMVLGEDTSDVPDRPGILYAANAHASEVEGSDVCMGLIREALRRYREGDADIIDLLRHVQVRIIPMHNPFGRLANERGYPGYLRKNHPGRSLPPPLDPLAITHAWPWDASRGTDINRNFNADWCYSGEFRDPAGNSYPGKRPGSAPETRALMRMARACRPQISINFHAPCGYPLLPGNWGDGQQPVDRELHYEIGRAFAAQSAPEYTAEVPHLSPEPAHLVGETAQAWLYREAYGAHLLPEGFYEQVPYESRMLFVSSPASLEELITGGMRALLWMGQRVRGAGITVYVRNANGRPLRAAVDVVDHMDPHCAMQYTDRQHGVYRRLLSPGRYTLRISRPGYDSQTVRIRTIPNSTTKVCVYLQRAGQRRDRS